MVPNNNINFKKMNSDQINTNPSFGVNNYSSNNYIPDNMKRSYSGQKNYKPINNLYNFQDEKIYKEIKQEINNRFLVINEGVKEKTKIKVKDKELEMLKESFVSGEETKISAKMKSAMSKVISKYILERKKVNEKKHTKHLNNEE